jgi:hypothetical protein
MRPSFGGLRQLRHGRVLAASAALLAVLLTIYLPDIGHGFLRDDFRWIDQGRSDSLSDIAALFTTNVGFYRPLVSISFAADYALWDLNAFGYAITNLLLLIASAALLAALVRRLGLPAAAAVLAAGVFAFNFHGVNMALLWLSGRTSLLALCFALLAVNAVLRGWHVAAGAACLAALLSKEEALALPLVMTVFLFFDPRGADGPPLRRTWAMWLALPIYAALRAGSGAFTPATAPDYYQYTLDPGAVLQNLGAYLDRAGTVAAGVSLLLWLLAPARRLGFSAEERRALWFAALWIPATFALTVLLPVRSSLYAVIPSAGCALIAAAFASRALRLTPSRFHVAAIALIVIAAALVPVYRMRNVRWVEPADLSRYVMESVQATTTSYPAGGRVVLTEDPKADLTLADAFDQLFPSAIALYSGELWEGHLVQPGAALPPDGRTTIVYELRQGTLEPTAITRR